MFNINSFDLQVIPPDFDRVATDYFNTLETDTVAVSVRKKTVETTFPSNVDDNFIADVTGEIVDHCQKRLNEYREQQERLMCGF